MANLRTNFTNLTETTLSSNITAGATAIPVNDTSNFPAVPFYIIITDDNDDHAEYEVILVDGSVGATQLNLTTSANRGLGGTTAQAHLGASFVGVVLTANAMNDLHDRVSTHAHTGATDDGVQIDTGDLSGHDKAAHDALNIDADTVDGSHASALLARANHTGTQAISTLSDHNKAAHDALTLDHGSLSGLSDDDHTHYLNNARHDTTARHGSSVVDHGSIGGLADDDHTQYALADGTRTWEVDGYTDGSVSTPSGSNVWEDELTVNLTIPGGWSGYKVFAHGAVGIGANSTIMVRVDIAGNTGHEVIGETGFASAAHRRTGLSSTGTVTVKLQSKDFTSGSSLSGDGWLHARAVRTS